MTKKTIDIILASKVNEDIQSDWFADYQAKIEGKKIIPHMDLDSIPEFTSNDDAIKWFNKQNLS